VATASTHACVVLSTGALECWGDDSYGELGDGKTTARVKPVAATVTGVTQVAVGSDFTCVLTTTGGVQCVGYNGSGQLGNGSVTDSTAWVTPTGLTSGVIGITAGDDFTCALLATGKAKCWGDGGNGQVGNGAMNFTTKNPQTVSGF
jgi:alpha-tubulin suppressor-like RCC1 family protein